MEPPSQRRSDEVQLVIRNVGVAFAIPGDFSTKKT